MLQQNSYGRSTMPLLMEFTPKTQIQEGGVNERFIYDSMMQITEYDMRTNMTTYVAFFSMGTDTTTKTVNEYSNFIY